MLNKSSLSILEKLEAISRWRKDNIRAFESPVAHDLIVFLALKFAHGQALTVKQLFVSQHYSYTAVRQYYKVLLNENLIRTVGDKTDRRIKYIEPTDKFFFLINSYANEISNNFPLHNASK
jgi:DNA-binding MarR family transcriptional regulator